MDKAKCYILFGLIVLVGLLTLTACTSGGATYTGEEKDGKRHGHWTFTFANGEKYVGEFKDGKFHGQGTLTSPGSTILSGRFEYNEYIGP